MRLVRTPGTSPSLLLRRRSLLIVSGVRLGRRVAPLDSTRAGARAERVAGTRWADSEVPKPETVVVLVTLPIMAGIDDDDDVSGSCVPDAADVGWVVMVRTRMGKRPLPARLGIRLGGGRSITRVSSTKPCRRHRSEWWPLPSRQYKGPLDDDVVVVRVVGECPAWPRPFLFMLGRGLLMVSVICDHASAGDRRDWWSLMRVGPLSDSQMFVFEVR